MSKGRWSGSRIWEEIYPFVGGVCCAAICWKFVTPTVMADVSVALASQVVTLVSILTAFIATSLTILLTAPSQQAIVRLKTNMKDYNRLVGQHVFAVRWGITAAVSSLLLLFLRAPFDGGYKTALFCGWVAVVGCSILLFYRVISLMQMLLFTQD